MKFHHFVLQICCIKKQKAHMKKVRVQKRPETAKQVSKESIFRSMFFEKDVEHYLLATYLEFCQLF